MFEPYCYGFLHRPSELSHGNIVLCHGAGGNCNAPLLIEVAEQLANQGWNVYRFDLPFRRRRPTGSPRPSTSAEDRDGIREAVQSIRKDFGGQVILGGHSYGGRQSTMAAAEDPQLADGLLLSSYPLHPPGKPARLRTAHFPEIRTKAAFVHGERDSFGSPEELREAITLIPARTSLHIVEKAGHDLGRPPGKAAGTIAAVVKRFFE